MTIEILGENNSDSYDVQCLACNDISEEDGDFLDRPLQIIGFEENATFEQAQEAAQRHNARYPDHNIVIRGFNIRKIREALYT